MSEEKKSGFLGQILIIGFIVLFIVGWYIVKEYYQTTSIQNKPMALTATAYEFGEKLRKDPSCAEKVYRYLRSAGRCYTEFNRREWFYLYFTSGYQTDSAYLVGQPLLIDDVYKSTSLSKCDSMILMYGNRYRLKEAAHKIRFSGDLINVPDSLIRFNYFATCEKRIGKNYAYRLENFCLDKVVVKAKIDAIKTTENGINVDLSDVLIVSGLLIKRQSFRVFILNFIYSNSIL